ncbi:MAG: HNH endonuclease signature motif containing protein [Sulfuricaulis sp.]
MPPHPYPDCSVIIERDITRFWSKVEKSDGCWLWRGAIIPKGYGYFHVGGRLGQNLGAHRVSWRITNGEIPKGMFVLHKCDVRNCVRPEHLWLGTAMDNTKDMVAKGRQPKHWKVAA